jgi:murein DD-endopeptidase MepM/ murein hydrolase activator NlpD
MTEKVKVVERFANFTNVLVIVFLLGGSIFAQEFKQSPDGNYRFIHFDCEKDNDGHKPFHCSVKLSTKDGDSIWTMPSVVSTDWSSDSRHFVVETNSSSVYVGDAVTGNIPNLVSTHLTKPSLSADGSRLIGEKLGWGDDIFQQLESSPGLVIIDFASRKETNIGFPGAFAPFFVDSDTIAFGQANQLGVIGLYTFDLLKLQLKRQTNRERKDIAVDPFPENKPVYDSKSMSLEYPATYEGVRRNFRIYLNEGKLIDEDLASNDVDRALKKSELAIGTVLSPNNAAATAVKFRQPFSAQAYDGIYQFFDHSGRDWGGGTRTYSGHQGTDSKLATGTSIVAAASGVPFSRVDGCPDVGSWTDTCGSGFGNNIRMRHSDGRVTIYAHLKNGTPINTSTNTITCGSQVGLSASSGKSTAPHLHFELRQSESGTRIDPYNASASAREWVSQPNSYPSGLVGTSCSAIQGNFVVSATITQTVTQGGVASYSVAISSRNGFNGSVSLTALNLPLGFNTANTRFSPQTVMPPVNGTAYSVLTIGTTTSTAVGTFPITIRGTSGSLISQIQSQIVVNRLPAPRIDGYSWTTTPRAGSSFGGPVNGANFVVGGTRVVFCSIDSGRCYEHPQAGIRVSSSSRLTLSGIRLGAGYWQFYLHNSGGMSAASRTFRVL